MTLHNNVEAEIWNDIYLKSVAEACDQYINQLPFGYKRDEYWTTQIESARWADEVVLFYRETR